MGALGARIAQSQAPKRAMQKAGDAAKAGGWKWGTMLRSKSWLRDSRVEGIDLLGGEVELRSFSDKGSTVRWVRSVPKDVEVVPS